MNEKILVALAGLTVLITGNYAAAHHGRASYSNEMITLEATVTEFKFINPHVQIYFDVINEAGEVEHWQGELTAPNKLARGGWTKNTLQPGDQIQINGRPARNGGHAIVIYGIVMPDGQSIPIWEQLGVPLF